MISTSSARIGSRIRATMAMGFALMLVATLAAATPTHAQADPAADAEAFQAAIAVERDAAQAQIDSAVEAIGVGCQGLGTEACLQRFVAVELPSVAAQFSSYADTLAALDAPDVYQDDVATHVATLRAVASLTDRVIVAAEAADDPTMTALDQEITSTLAALVPQLDAEYARPAFLSPGRGLDYLGVYGTSTPAELAYLRDIGAAPQAAAENFACFSRAVSVTYGATTELMGALYDCGAGTALPAIEARGAQLTPPARFTDEHEWWLEMAAEQSRLDRLIGEAAREGDVAKFLANNARLGLASRPSPDFDRAFVTEVVEGPASGAVLDPADPLSRSAYGRALFAALVDFQLANPLFTGLGVLGFPQVPREEALPAITEVAPELRALEADIRGTVASLVPPEEVAADHARIVEFLELRRDGLEALIQAAGDGDVDATFDIENAIPASFCAALGDLSDAIRPLANVAFHPDDPACR